MGIHSTPTAQQIPYCALGPQPLLRGCSCNVTNSRLRTMHTWFMLECRARAQVGSQLLGRFCRFAVCGQLVSRGMGARAADARKCMRAKALDYVRAQIASAARGWDADAGHAACMECTLAVYGLLLNTGLRARAPVAWDCMRAQRAAIAKDCDADAGHAACPLRFFRAPLARLPRHRSYPMRELGRHNVHGIGRTRGPAGGPVRGLQRRNVHGVGHTRGPTGRLTLRRQRALGPGRRRRGRGVLEERQ